MLSKKEKIKYFCVLLAAAIKKTTIGGQALMEGLMMVGPERVSVACRRRDGSINVQYLPPVRKNAINRVPILRGAVGLFRQMILGTKAMMLAAAQIEEDENSAAEQTTAAAQAATDARPTADVQAATDARPTADVQGAADAQATAAARPEAVIERNKPSQQHNSLTTYALYGSAILGMVGGIAMFVLLPNLLAGLILRYSGLPIATTGKHTFIYSLFEGVIRLVILLGYLYLTSCIKDISRIWRYHGAEHKTIACYEAGEDLTVDNVARHSRFHPRCGTSFLFLLVFCSVFLFSIVGWYGLWLNLLIRLLLVPILAGLSYELLRWSGTHDRCLAGRIIATPGLWVQRLTTKEPDAPIIEVAIAAMKEVIPEDGRADIW